MSLYQRNDSPHWWVKISHSGRTIQRSTGTENKCQAQEYHDKLKASLWEQERLGIRPSHTWNEAVVRYVAEISHKTTQVTDRFHLRWLDRFLNAIRLEAIDREVLEAITAARLAEGVAHATANRTLEVVRQILRKAAFEWDWMDKVPKFRMLLEPKRRVRFLNREEAERLLAELPEHLAAMARFSLKTGLRRANVTGLLWSQLDLDKRSAWIHADQAKGRKPIAVPLSAGAVMVLRQQVGTHPTHVFSFRAKPVQQVNTKAWQAALKRAGIADFRWHDLRHTWASWHAQAGTPLHVLQELGGWESAEMVRKYAHLSTEHLADYVDRAARLHWVAEREGEKAVVTNSLRAQK